MLSIPQSPDSIAPDRNPLAAEAYEALKAAISSGELQPRERLYETVLAKRLKMSRTPVREALQRLVNEGLAETGPDGATVAALSVKDIRSLEQANRALQSLAAELAASEGSEEDMAKLEELMARMEACAGVEDTDGWITADQAIHCG
jgi:DNA-binding GntR family transcriptional regulator